MALTTSFYSYVYVDPRNDEPFYVGKGKRDRAYAHLKGSHNKLVQSKVNKIRATGQEPLIGILETSTEEFAFMLEQGLIKLLGRKDNGTGILCNFTDGGEGSSNFIVSAEHKRKISEKLKGKVRGPMPEEQKQKMIATKQARHVPKIWMNKDGLQTKVVLAEIDTYLANGWSKGRDRKHLTQEFCNKMRESAIRQRKRVKEQSCR